MREIDAKLITDTVARLCVEANRNLPGDVACALEKAAGEETFAPAKDLLDILIRNKDIAREEQMPICQDTGMAIIFAEIGQEVHILGDFTEAVNKGVSIGYTEGLLRKSVVRDPLRRVNTGDNTPAVIHTTLVPGDKITITVAPKGFGSENMSRLAMLPPAKGIEGVKAFVRETVQLAGANPCPPMVLGVGIGADFEGVAELAKRALMVPLTEQNPDPFYAELEQALLEIANETGVGPQGLGGKTTCLGVHVLAAPTHIASLPVAVNVSCHVTRHQTAVI
ncbi:MAG: fumarate hydratase [Clostridia bacterium]|nr:fumarate hydratase [Clostridia bacterium]